jgi:hypothetical protein
VELHDTSRTFTSGPSVEPNCHLFSLDYRLVSLNEEVIDE